MPRLPPVLIALVMHLAASWLYVKAVLPAGIFQREESLFEATKKHMPERDWRQERGCSSFKHRGRCQNNHCCVLFIITGSFKNARCHKSVPPDIHNPAEFFFSSCLVQYQHQNISSQYLCQNSYEKGIPAWHLKIRLNRPIHL